MCFLDDIFLACLLNFLGFVLESHFVIFDLLNDIISLCVSTSAFKFSTFLIEQLVGSLKSFMSSNFREWKKASVNIREKA